MDNPVLLTIHRSAHEIGGNCIEIATPGGHRILLDAGRPLDAPESVRAGLIPPTLNMTYPVDAVLLSHPHQDHYGLLDELPACWPLYSGPACEKLVRLTAGIFGSVPSQKFHNWTGGMRFDVGPFAITPLLTDHSAFDAYQLLIEVNGRRLLYSGDFRMHGRKNSLVRALIARPPANLDGLILEGTNLGSDKPCMTETALEWRFADLFKATAGRVFVAWSAQNIDRTVTIYRACLRSERTLVVDLYTAEVLDRLASFARLPRPGWRNLKVVVTSAFARMYRRKGREEFVSRMAKYGIAADKLAETPSKWVVMIRPSLMGDYQFKGVIPTSHDAWSWSMWQGYLKNEDGRKVQAWFDDRECPATHIHTSGHASPTDLRCFAGAIKPRSIIPVHGANWDRETRGFPPVNRLTDGQTVAI